MANCTGHFARKSLEQENKRLGKEILRSYGKSKLLNQETSVDTDFDDEMAYILNFWCLLKR